MSQWGKFHPRWDVVEAIQAEIFDAESYSERGCNWLDFAEAWLQVVLG